MKNKRNLLAGFYFETKNQNIGYNGAFTKIFKNVIQKVLKILNKCF
jgi:hypothetical protein